MCSQRYTYFDPDPPGGAVAFNGATWYATIFYNYNKHILSSVKLRLSELMGNPNTITVSIRLHALGKPIGSDLSSGTTDGNTLPISPATELREINMSPYQLSGYTLYAIVVRAPTGVASALLWWGSPSAGEHYARSNDSGVTWTSFANTQFHFEEWGDSGSGSVDKSIIGDKVSLEAIRNLEFVYGGRNYISKSGIWVYESRYHRNV